MLVTQSVHVDISMCCKYTIVDYCYLPQVCTQIDIALIRMYSRHVISRQFRTQDIMRFQIGGQTMTLTGHLIDLMNIL